MSAWNSHIKTMLRRLHREPQSDSGEWKQEGGKWYFYRDGGRMSGWVNPDGYWYYLDPAELGAMVTGTTKNIDGVDYSLMRAVWMQ